MTADMLTIGVALLAALAVLLIFAALASGSSVNERLRRYASAEPDKATEADKAARPNLGELLSSSNALVNLNRAVENKDWGAHMARELARADLALKPSEYLAVRAGALLGVPMAMVALSPVVSTLNNPLFWAGGLVVGFMLPRLWVNRRKAKRLKAFNSGLADTITLLSNALRAGSSFLQAIEMVVRETQPPISTEFGRVIREVNLGLPLEQALANMTRRVRSDDLDLMATAITIHHQVGGNLAEILDSIAFTIRERVRIKGEIKTLTAQQRMSGYVVGFLPIALVLLISVMAPDFLQPLFLKPPEVFGVPLGMIALGFGGFMMLIGFVAIRRIVDIEV
ncbi:MAG TPA: type II secretion system F family protein [Candidatus Limnocylindrales bacterium]|jgi:tight adherence protein B|nr:type II secretion system F family protein [Candidatus Limnocylindrales bacterium]